MALGINNAKSMSLLSFSISFFFSPSLLGEWVGSKGLPYQQLPFSLFLTLLAFSSSFNILFITTHCAAVFCVSPLVTFSFLFSFGDLCAFPSRDPHSLLFPLSLYLPYSIFPLSFHVSLHKPPFLSILFHLIWFVQISYTPTVHFSFHLFVFLDYRLLSFFSRVLEKWEGESRRGEKRVGNKAPQSQRDSLSLSGFNLLIRSSRTHRTLHLDNTSYPPPPTHPLLLLHSSYPRFRLPS